MRFLLGLLIAGMALSAPLAASAADVNFFGPIVPAECNCPAQDGNVQSAPGWGCVLSTIQNLMAFAISIGVIIVTLMMAYAGILWIASPFNPHNREEGRTLLINSVIGLVIALASWLIVDFVMKALYNGSAAAEITGKASPLPWNSILGEKTGSSCLVEQKPSVEGVIQGRPVGSSSGPSPSTSGGSCKVPTSGPCTVDKLQSVFGSVASQAAQICVRESGGIAQNLSKTDRLLDGNPYSVGLFQINLTNSFSKKVNGKSCSQAFSGPCGGKDAQGRNIVVQSGPNTGRCSQTIVDRTLYNACVAAAQSPSANIAEAKRLYDGDWGAWVNSARDCRLPS